MSKINRREYLKQIGLATAGAMGTKHLAGLRTFASTSSADDADTTDSSNSNDVAVVQAHRPWPQGIKPVPADFGVKLIFVGMCIFGYKGKEARVAFHRGHTHTHKMKIIVSEKGTPCSDIYSIGDGSHPIPINTIEVGIEDKSSNVNFFLGPDFNRATSQGDELDFRWLIDLEGPDGYNTELPKHDRHFKAKMKVKHGTFYTYQRTYATFQAEGGPFPGRKFGPVAKVMAANIPRLSNGESVYLHINKRDVLPYPLTNRAQYEIYFLNEPYAGDYDDFDMVFDAFNVNSTDQFKLRLVTPGREIPLSDICHPTEVSKKATDEAPCMGGSFGTGKGLP
jgi:hypothetical protein